MRESPSGDLHHPPGTRNPKKGEQGGDREINSSTTTFPRYNRRRRGATNRDEPVKEVAKTTRQGEQFETGDEDCKRSKGSAGWARGPRKSKKEEGRWMKRATNKGLSAYN